MADMESLKAPDSIGSGGLNRPVVKERGTTDRVMEEALQALDPNQGTLETTIKLRICKCCI